MAMPNVGYVTDQSYTHGDDAELNLLRLRLLLLNAGWMPPVIDHACGIGFGQGVSVNLHAVASSVSWRRTVLNASHTRETARPAATTGWKTVGIGRGEPPGPR